MRLFIAFPLPEPVPTQLDEIISSLRRPGDNIKWVRPENLHLTVRFLGETDERLVPSLAVQIDRAAREAAPAECVIDRVGCFPNRSRPRVIWVGLSGSTDILTSLAANIELAVQDMGFSPEKKRFQPHLTLGRVRRNGKAGDLTERLDGYRLEPLPLRLDRLALIKSTLTPAGPIYQVLHEAVLGESPADG
jgi:2'-5' RNA ligase